MKNHYTTLGITKNASHDDIKRAYRQMAKKFHPDKNEAADAEERFKEIAGAYETLSDADKKRVYDNILWSQEERAKRKQTEAAADAKTTHKTTSTSQAKPSNTTAGSGGHTSYTYTTNNGKFSFKSTFSTFSSYNENTSKRDKTEPKETKKGKKNKEKGSDNTFRRGSFGRERPEWDSDWADTEKKQKEKPSRSRRPDLFSFNFHFTDGAGDDPMADMDDLFNDAMFGDIPSSFRKPFVFTQHGPAEDSTKKASHMRFDDDADPDTQGSRSYRSQRAKEEKENENLMYDWSKPPWKDRPKKDKYGLGIDYNVSLSDSEEDLTDEDSDFDDGREACSFCGRRFNPTSLRKHEVVCGKWNSQPNKASYSKAQPEPSGGGGRKRNGNWRTQHEKLIRNVRNAREAAKAQREGKPMPPPPPPEPNLDFISLNGKAASYYVTCRHCYRRFSEKAAERHIPVCSERTKERGEPVNPSGKPVASDFGSKAYYGKKYAENIPKPNQTPRRSYDTQTSNSGACSHGNQGKGPMKGFTSRRGGAPNTSNTARDYMDEPYTTTGTGLHAPKSNSTPRSNVTPRSRQPTLSGVKGKQFTGPKAKQFYNPNGSSRRSQGYHDNVDNSAGCLSCQKEYGTKNAKFYCSCGTKTSLL